MGTVKCVATRRRGFINGNTADLVVMKRIILTIGFCILLTLGINAQCVATDADPCLSVNQSTINKAGRVADELAAARDAIAKFTISTAASDAERAAAMVLVKGLNDLISTKDKIIAEYEAINELYKKAINFQAVLIERLQNQLMKPKTGWQKFVGVLEKIVVLLAGVAIGAL